MPLGPRLGLDTIRPPAITRDNRDGYQSNDSEGEQDQQLLPDNNTLQDDIRKHRPRPARYPRPHSHLFFSPTTGRMLKGSRHTQRYRNSLYLQTLFPLTEEELAEDYHKITPDYQSAFTQVLSNNHTQLLWESFSKLSEERQWDVLKMRRGQNSKKKVKSHDRRGKGDEDESFLKRISPEILKSLLHDKKLSQGFMESIEKELYEYFLEDSSSIIIYVNLTSYHRMLVHAVCQYNGYSSKTYHVDKDTCYVMISCDQLDPPPVPLFKSLQGKHIS